MKILYFDCFAGISGDMTIGALLDLGIDKDKFVEEISKINVNGFKIEFGRVDKNGINAFNVDVVLDGLEEENAHHHGNHDNGHGHECHHEHNHNEHTDQHSHIHRNLFDVNKIIDESRISDNAKDLAKKIFMRVALAEAKVHGKDIEVVHFHEVGALDSIVDIIGTAICIDLLKPDKIYSSVVNDGYGFIMCQHGQIPVPVPATVEIFANSKVISRQIDVEMELVTPTGAAIIAELPESYGICPTMKVIKTGYGAGKRSSKIPNVLRVMLGEKVED